VSAEFEKRRGLGAFKALEQLLLSERLDEWFKQGRQALESAAHGPQRQRTAEVGPIAQETMGRLGIEVFVEQDLDPHGHAEVVALSARYSRACSAPPLPPQRAGLPPARQGVEKRR